MPTTITLRVEDQFSSQLQDFANKLKQAEDAAKGTAEGVKEADAATQKAAASTQQTGLRMTELHSALGLAREGLRAIQGAYEAVIAPTLQYSDQIRALTREIGANAEQASLLIQAADDVQISYGTLSTALEAAIRKGIRPSIEGLGELADQYNAIQDPIARTKFLMDNFGRSGADLAPLMELGSQGIADLGDKARNTGLVMSQDGVKAARDYEIAADNLSDAFKGMAYSLAGDVIPALTEFMNTEAQAIGLTDLLAVAVKRGALNQQEANDIAAAVHFHGLTVAEATQLVTDKLNAQAAALAEANAHYDDYAQRQAVGAREARQHGDALEYLSGKAELAVGNLAKVGREASHTGSPFAIRNPGELLEAGMGGAIGRAGEAYQATIDDTSKKIEKLQAEIAKYTALQGKTVTVTTEATISQDEYNLSVDKANLAQGRYEDALRRAGEGQNVNAFSLEGMRIAAEEAWNHVDKLSTKLSESKEVTLNYSKLIADDTVKLGELTDSQKKAEAQLLKTTEQFIFQHLAAGMDDQSLLTLAKTMGLIDPASAAAEQAVLDLRKSMVENKLSAEDMGIAADHLAQIIAGLQSKHIEITIDTIYRQYAIDVNEGAGYGQSYGTPQSGPGSNLDSGGPAPAGGHFDPVTGQWIPGYAKGGRGVVPQGYPNDSYMIGLSSGEEFAVKPAGQKGGWGGVTINGGIHVNAPAATNAQGIAASIDRALAARLRGTSRSGAGVQGLS